MKIVSIHQPQYIPWVPYFDKALQSDVFVLLDHVQFEKNGMQNRNQIKSPQGPLWLTLPVKHNFGQSILETQISDPRAAAKHIKTLQMCYKKAPFYDEIMPLLEEPLSAGYTSLSVLCCDITVRILSYLEYQGTVMNSSQMNVEGRSSDLVLNICKSLDAEVYIAGQGGKNYMKLEDFEAAGVKVVFQKYSNQEYTQCYSKVGFCKDLSIIDLLFNAGPESLAVLKKGRVSEVSLQG